MPWAQLDGAEGQPGFDGIISRVFQSYLDPTESQFFTRQMVEIVGTEETAGSQLNLFEVQTNDATTAKSGQNVGHFDNMTSFNIEEMEEQEFTEFYRNKLEGKTMSFFTLVKLVMCHLLQVQVREIYPTGPKGAMLKLEGPSPVLYFNEQTR